MYVPGRIMFDLSAFSCPIHQGGQGGQPPVDCVSLMGLHHQQELAVFPYICGRHALQSKGLAVGLLEPAHKAA